MRHIKTVALFLIMALLITALPVAAISGTADEATSVFDDAGLETLAKLGVFDRGAAVSVQNETMSRAELAELAVKLRGWDNLADTMGKKRYFYDVKEEDARAAFISAAVAGGLMTAKETGYFVPDAAVTWAEAAETILRVLGYEAYVKAKEDTTALAAANQLGLLKRISMGTENPTTADIYGMIKNSLEIEVLWASQAGDSVVYSKEEDVNLLAKYHKVYRGKGIVTANQNTGLELISESVGKGEIQIGSEVFDMGATDYGDHIGRRVVYYYREDADGSERELVYLTDEKNDIITLKPQDIQDFSNMTYFYYFEDEIEEADVSEAYVIYNDAAVELGDFDYIPVNGDVTLIDNDRNGYFDVVLINEYTDCIVSGMDFAIETVYFQDAAAIDLRKTDARVYNAPNGAVLNVKGFRRDDTVSVARDAKGNITKIVVSHAFVTGFVTQMADEGATIVTIRDKEYRLSGAFADRVAANQTKELYVGANGWFYLNHLGEIAHWEPGEVDYTGAVGTWEFGILNAAKQETGLSDKLLLQIYSVANDFETFEVSKNVVVDGDSTTYATNALVYKALCRDGENGVQKTAIVKQIIRFKRNKSNVITEIDRVGDADSGGLYEYYDGAATWASSGGNFGGNGLLDRRSTVIICPLATDGTIDTSNLNNMRFGTKNSLTHQKSYNITLYKTDPLEIASPLCYVADNPKPTLTYSVPYYVLLDVVQAVDAEGEEQTKIKYAKSDDKGTIIESEGFLNKDYIDINNIELSDGSTYSLKKGDVFRLSITGDKITYIQPIFDNVNRVMPEAKDTGNYTMSVSAQARYGYVKKAQDDMILCGYNNPEDGTEGEFAVWLNTVYTDVCVYDRETGKFTPGSIQQLVDYASAGDDCTRFVLNIREKSTVYQFFIFK